MANKKKAEEINEMFKVVTSSPMKEGPLSFIESLQSQWEEFKNLTPNQVKGLKKFYANCIKSKKWEGDK